MKQRKQLQLSKRQGTGGSTLSRRLAYMLLLLVTLFAGSSSAWAEDGTVTIGLSSKAWTYSVQNSVISVTAPSQASSSSYHQINNGDFTITAEEGTKITSVVLIFDRSAAIKISVDGGTAEEYNITTNKWTGSASSITFSNNASSSQARIAGATVTYTTSSDPDPTPAPKYTLTFGVNPTGAASISAVLYGTETPVQSGDSFEEKTKITITPSSANPGYTRILGANAAWTGSSTATNEITWTMGTSNKNLVANFRGNVITFNTDGGDAIDPITYAGSAIELPTPAKVGYNFDGWYNGEDKINESSYTPLTDVTLTAHWVEAPTKIDVARFNMMGSQTYKHKVGNNFDLVAYIGGLDWPKNLENSQIQITSLNTSAVTVNHFSINNNQKDDSSGNKLSSITVNLDAIAAGDAKIKIEFLGNDGYNAAEYTTRDVETIHVYETRTVNFSSSNIEEGSVSATQNDNSIANGAEVESGSSVTFTATPNSGYLFDNWHDGSQYISDNPYTTTVNANLNLTANFIESRTINVALATGCESMGTVAIYARDTTTPNLSGVEIKKNVKIDFTAIANDDFNFLGWKTTADGSGDYISQDAIYKTKAESIATGSTLYAYFEPEAAKIVTTAAHTWDLTTLTTAAQDNDGVDSGSDYALYWNTKSGVVKDNTENDKLGLTGLKINSTSDTYIIIPGNATGVLKVTFAPRYKNQETGVAVNGKDAEMYDGTSVKEFSFNVANSTAENMTVSIKRATSTAREGVITKIVWTPLQASDLAEKTAVTMLAGHDYINTVQLAKDTHYTTSSTGALTYTSYNTDIVTVDANGLLTAKKAGITTITINQAATFDYAAGSCDVTVNVSDLYASSNAVEVAKDGTIDLDIETSSTGAITVTSDNGSIATASYNSSTKKLTITGVADGNATIKVTEAAVSGQYVKSEITISVSVYTSKVYYQVTDNEATHKLLLNDAIKSAEYLSVSSDNWQKKDAKLDGVAADNKYYQLKSTDRVMKVNVQGAKAFEIFAIGGSNRTYYLNVDGVNVGMINAPSGTTSSGLFECVPEGSTITLTGNNGDVFPAQIKFYTTLPSIIKVNNSSAFSEITDFVDANDLTYTVSSNNSSAINVSDVDASIATVALTDGILTVNPVKAGSFTMKLSQDAATIGSKDYAAAEMDIKVTIKKHALKLSYDKSQISIDKNTDPSATLTEAATLSCTIDGVATAISDLSTKGVTVTYDSDDLNVATVTNTGVVSLASQPQGTATITASIANNNNYSVTSATHKIAVIDGYNFKMNAAGTKSEINKLYPIYGEGEEEADNILAGIYYGGWKYKKKYSSDEEADSKWISDGKEVDGNGHKVITDSWPNSKEYSRAGSAEKIYIDGYQQQTQANNNARSENVTRFVIGKPFSLPVRGAYMKFDAERTGVMTAYFVQNGDLDYADDGVTLKEGFARRSYFITDEFGNIVTPISAMSKEKLPNQTTVIEKALKNNTENENYIKALADNALAEDGTGLKSWTWNTTDRQPVLYDEATKGYHVLQKAYVKYVFNVEAGKSYYVFSSASKIGFAGANFQVDDAAELITKNIAHEATLELDQTADYTAPEKKTWYDEVTINRSFNAGEWSTIVLPFSLSEAKVKEIFGDDVQLTVFNGVQGSVVNFFYHVNQNIIAGYPYIILPSKDVESITVKNVTIDPDVNQYVFDSSSQGGHPSWKGNGDYLFKGLDGYSKASDKETMCKYSYYMAADGLHRTTSGTLTCNGYRAYLKYTGSPSEAPAKLATITVSGIEEELDDNTATAIMAAIDADDMFVPAAVKGVYNLNGQKIAESAEGLSNGIYVINGKKIIINK